MKITWKTELPQWLAIGAMFLLAAVSWDRAPERIPVHWNLSGEADRYGGKLEGLLGIPLLALALYFAFRLMPLIDPGRLNYARFAGVYHTLRIGILAVIVSVYALVHLWIRGRTPDVGAVVGPTVGALFVLLGGLMGKIRPNWFVGIRTPWTISSKRAWIRTHRVGGWVFIASGILIAAAGLTRAAWLVWTFLAVLIGGLAATAAYSYFVWRGDPEKIPPTGTSPAEDEEAKLGAS